MNKRKITVTTGTRAEYGILRPILFEIIKSKKLDLFLIVTGSHLSKKYGLTINEIKKDKIKIYKKFQMISDNDSVFDSTLNLGKGIIQFGKIFNKIKPDINLVLGDRDEMLASSLAAYHMNIPNAHIHGGDKSGGLDEYTRHAITKISNIHFPATLKSKVRIKKMGENPKNIFQVGSPAIDEIINNKIPNKKELEQKYNLTFNGEEIILIYHPVTTEINESKKQILEIMKVIVKLNLPTIAIAPNSDPGNKQIFSTLLKYSKRYPQISLFENLPRSDYLGMLKNCSMLIGNSSSGMIESNYYHIPVVNIGIRQQNRERGSNVIDVPNVKYNLILKAIKQGIKKKNFKNFKKIYGSGKSSKNIINCLETINLDSKLIKKELSY